MIQVTAHDADDPAYGNSARLVYTVLEGLPFFSVDPQTGTQWGGGTEVGWRGAALQTSPHRAGKARLWDEGHAVCLQGMTDSNGL